MKAFFQPGIRATLGVALLGGGVAWNSSARSAPAFVPLTASSSLMVRQEAHAYAPLETAFQIPDLPGDPFDFVANDVRVQLRLPNGQLVSLPAFFDGNATWCARHTPDLPGQYEVVGVTRNGQTLSAVASPRRWTVSPQSALVAGFVRLDPRNPQRFVRDGARFYPLGHNQAWHSNGLPDIPQLFDKMGAAGENWSRVWMNHWDGKNLDWLPDGSKPGPFGTLSLDVARRWDAVVQAAQRNGIAFQMTLQHHGQYSSEVNPNWNDNPYNAKNGGFLQTPEEFFTSARAKELTKRKLRYAVARWGYSPSIMAWELFNEVQFTDAARHGQGEAVGAWHREMADFLRSQDVYGHLITSSSVESAPPSIWAPLNYIQEHDYPTDVITALSSGNRRADLTGKPFFVGEFGPQSVQDPTGLSLHAGLWAGMMSGEAGAPQFWTWDDVERGNLYFHFRAAAEFVRASGFSSRDGWKKTSLSLSTPTRSDLSFGPGGGWGQTRQNEFSVSSDGPPEGIGTLPSFVQGEGNRTLGPKPLVFRVNFAQPGQFLVQLAQVARRGAHLKLSVDGGAPIERDFPASAQDFAPQNEAAQLAVKVAPGPHVVTLENSGADWVQVQRFTLSSYAPALGSLALSSSDALVAWIYHRTGVMDAPGSEAPAASGQLLLSGLKAGRYRATWWDTRAGKALETSDVALGAGPGTGSVTLNTPPVTRDVALFVVPLARVR